MSIIELVVVLIVIATVLGSIKIVPVTQKQVVMMFGKYRKLFDPGINFVIPFVTQTHAIDMRTQSVQLPIQEVITRDNSSITVDAIIYSR
jgi:regulator of protease activity HflC (stomatin/prohibitin superfamily)